MKHITLTNRQYKTALRLSCQLDDIAQEIDDLTESIKLDHPDDLISIEIVALVQARDHIAKALAKFNWIKRPY
jgi:chorismate mutase